MDIGDAAWYKTLDTQLLQQDIQLSQHSLICYYEKKAFYKFWNPNTWIGRSRGHHGLDLKVCFLKS